MSGIPRRVSGVLLEAAGDEWVAYVRSSDTAHAMNASAGALFHQIDGVRTVDELAEMLELDVDVALLGVRELVEAGLVSMDSADVANASRRQLLKKIGVGTAAAAALPIVETIVAPTRAAASSLPDETERPRTPFPTPGPTFTTPAPTPLPTPGPTFITPAPTPLPTPLPTPGPTSTDA